MLIHEVAERVGICTDTLRRLERKGIISSRRDENGWRHFSESTVKRLREFYAKDDKGNELDAA